MSNTKYRYNPGTLSYERYEGTIWSKVIFGLSIGVPVVMAIGIIFLLFTPYFDSPREKELIRELDQLKFQYTILNKRMGEVDKVVNNIADRDDNIYRVIFEAEPIPKEVREAGFGGSDRYKGLKGFDNSELVMSTTK